MDCGPLTQEEAIVFYQPQCVSTRFSQMLRCVSPRFSQMFAFQPDANAFRLIVEKNART